MGRLFLLFTVVPLLELYLLMAVGRVLGLLPTIALVLLTGAVGAFFARMEGMRVLRSWQQSMASQTVPKDGLIDGVLIFVGGLMLVTPGIVTDALGLSMVIPATRRPIAAAVRRWVDREMERGRLHVVTTAQQGVGVPPGGFSPGGSPVSEVQAEVISAETVE